MLEKRICQPRGRSAPELRATDGLLASIHKISKLLTRPVPLNKILIAIVKQTSVAFGLKRVGIYLTNKDKTLLECKYIIGFSPLEAKRALARPFRLNEQDCIETRVVRFGKTIFVEDLQTYSKITAVDLKSSQVMMRVSALVVPMKIKKDVIGLIVADRDQVQLKLTRQDLGALSTFANLAAIIIENARLLEHDRKKIKQLLTLQEVSRNTNSLFDFEELLPSELMERDQAKIPVTPREINRNANPLLNLEKLLNTICTSAVRISNASSGVLFLADADGRFLRIGAYSGFSDPLIEAITLPVGDGLAGRVALNAAPVIVDNLVKSLYQGLQISWPALGVKSAIAVPLIRKKQVLGILEVFSPDEAAFCDEDLKLLTIFAGYAESLLRNLRLYEQMTVERNLKENILESSANGVIAVNLKKKIISVNRRAEDIFQIKRTDVYMLQPSDILEQDISKIFDLALSQNNVLDIKEVRREGKDGKTRILGISSSPLRNHWGDLIGAMIRVKDLTETRQAEAAMVRMEKLTSLGQLSAGIAHEIRNPLSSIYFNVQMLSKRLAVDETMKGIFADTFEGIERIKGLVKSVLDFAKPSAPSLKFDSIVPVLEHSISIVDPELKKNKIQIELDLPDELPDIVIDSRQIRLVFVNLLLNAIEGMPSGGKITIKSMIDTIELGNIRHRNGHILSSDRLMLEIKDTGIGISPEHLPRIFDPFFTTKPEGTGLGLSIVHKILAQHDATIDVYSDRNSGTAFVLHFPIRSFGLS
ncbi:MAG: GAF domain-containing protein [Syntrophobacteraceae bacterium]